MRIILNELRNKPAYLVVLALAIVANIVIVSTVTKFGPNVLY